MKLSHTLYSRTLVSTGLTALMLAIVSPAAAVGFTSFSCITNNNAADCTIGTDQLSATVVTSSADALLTITMTGPSNAVATTLYIESSIVTGISFVGSAALGIVDYAASEAGGMLPGGPGFDEAFNVPTRTPLPEKGIGRHGDDDFSPQAGEFLLSLGGESFESLLADLRIGVHVQGYDGGGSEAYIASPVPEPGTALLLGMGMSGLALFRRGAPQGVDMTPRTRTSG